MRLDWRLALVAVVVLVGIAIALTNDKTPTDRDLAQAMCADLRDGMSLFQIHSQGVKHYREIGRSEDAAQSAAAHLEDDATRSYCPEFRHAFEATYAYEDWIAE